MGYNCFVKIFIEYKNEELLNDFLLELKVDELFFNGESDEVNNEFYYEGMIYNGHKIEDMIKETLKKKKYKELEIHFGYVNLEDIDTELIKYESDN